MAKELRFGDDARQQILAGVNNSFNSGIFLGEVAIVSDHVSGTSIQRLMRHLELFCLNSDCKNSNISVRIFKSYLIFPSLL